LCAVSWPEASASPAVSHGALLLVLFSIENQIVPVPLQAERALFDPPLPTKKVEAIQRMGYGTVDKIIVDFASRPIGDARDAESRGNNDCDAPSTSFQLLWNPPGAEENGEARLPGWVRGAYGVRLGGSEFVGGSIGTVSGRASDDDGSTRRAAATLWMTGLDAIAMEEASREELQDGVMALLEQFPNLKLPIDRLQPTKIYRSTWALDLAFRGSYSFIAVGSSIKDLEVLAEPLTSHGSPMVFFAGEATHRKYYGTVHGAFLSGEREARRLIQSRSLQSRV
jgi:spermine oxidase